MTSALFTKDTAMKSTPSRMAKSMSSQSCASHRAPQCQSLICVVYEPKRFRSQCAGMFSMPGKLMTVAGLPVLWPPA